MTNGEFISRQLEAFGITGADLVVLADDVDLEGKLDVEAAERGMIPLLASLILRPYQKSISENGFSVSWDMSRIGWWYRYLCSKYGIKPDANIEEASGLSVIVDRTSKW